ncbi:MAG: sulfatase [Opitutaceae bacterium]
MRQALKIPFFLLALLAGLTALTRAQDKPNLILILADDLGWHQLGCYGSDFYETPVLDRMAAEGMRFTNAYAAAPVCSPTRGSIMTGKYPARTHLTVNIPTGRNLDRPTVTPEFAESLPLDEVTVAEALKTAGYTTGHFGKWHLNRDKDYAPDRPGDPASQGFDVVLTTHKLDEGPPSPYENDWQHVHQITEAAIAFIEENQDRPFFAYVSHNSIHRPEKEKDTLIAKYRAKPGADNDVEYGHNNPVQAAMLEVLDASVGRILDRLGELGLAKNTLVVFFSDNGHLGPKDGFPLKGSKADLYEGGIRLPLIVRQPGTVPAGTTRDTLVISNDFFPTFCRLAGVNTLPSGIDGMDISDLLRGSETGPARDTLFFHFPHYHALGVGPQSALREENLKLIENTEARLLGLPDAFELYDLAADPAERHNLAGEQPGTVGRLRDKLELWKKAVGAQEMTRPEQPGSGGQTR